MSVFCLCISWRSDYNCGLSRLYTILRRIETLVAWFIVYVNSNWQIMDKYENKPKGFRNCFWYPISFLVRAILGAGWKLGHWDIEIVMIQFLLLIISYHQYTGHGLYHRIKFICSLLWRPFTSLSFGITFCNLYAIEQPKTCADKHSKSATDAGKFDLSFEVKRRPESTRLYNWVAFVILSAV